MTPEEILEGSKLIEEYKGNIVKANPDGNEMTVFINNIPFYGLKECCYHTSWDRLMPVVEMISIDYDVSISSVGMWACFINKQNLEGTEITSYGGYEPLITNVFLSVVKFIKWFNQQKES